MLSQRPIATAEQAINRGKTFLSENNYLISRPISAKREGEQWTVVFNVSIIGPRQVVRMTIDSQTGDIMELSDDDT